MKSVQQTLKKGEAMQDRLLKTIIEYRDNGCLDLGDIGDDVGVVLGEFISRDSLGWDVDDFVWGVYHGISKIDGTHG